MASLFVLPRIDFELPSSVGSYNNCGCIPRRIGPTRPRYQRRHRWNPLELPPSFLDFLAEDAFHEGPSVVVRRKQSNQSETTPSAEGTSSHVSERNGQVGSENFKVSLELGKDFTPEELSVKVVDRTLRIEGKHEERGEDDDFSFRQFTRSYHLSDDVNIEKLNSRLSKEGLLSIEAPRFEKKALTPVERNIPIEQKERSSVDANRTTAESEEENKGTEDEQKESSQEEVQTTKLEEKGSDNAEQRQ